MDSSDADTIELIPIERITVINPRVRNKKIFKEIVENIAELGLKRPITVTRRDDADGLRYALVCGQGRLEAYQALGQHEIPAIVVKADTEDCMVMSLVENLARRQHRAIDRSRASHKTAPAPAPAEDPARDVIPVAGRAAVCRAPSLPCWRWSRIEP